MSVKRPQDGVTTTAAQACSSCKKQKRKCDKALPECSLCIRIGRPCEYTTAEQADRLDSAEFDALKKKVHELESLIATSTPSSDQTSNGTRSATFDYTSPSSVSSAQLERVKTQDDAKAMFFMDSSTYPHLGTEYVSPFVSVPKDAMSLLGDAVHLRHTIETYFDLIHPSFPIVSKIRLYQHLSNPQHEPGADLALLFAAIKLIVTEVTGTGAETQLYKDVRHLLDTVESLNCYTIATMQALLLVSLYELGHAIWPAAYMTTGRAARMAYAMGLHSEKVSHMLVKTVTWTEQEERRRVMWAVVVLDRYAHAGFTDRPFATQDPSLGTCLSIDDEAWDNGIMRPAASLSLSATQTVKASPFARTCQAAHLLGKAVRHIGDTSVPIEYRCEEALQLNKTIRALLGAIEEDMAAATATAAGLLFPAFGMTLSAALSLFDHYCCTSKLVEDGPEIQLQVQKQSIDGIDEMTVKAVDFAEGVEAFGNNYGRSRLSPLIIDALYQGMANCAWYHRESSAPEMIRKTNRLKEIMQDLAKRWRAAGKAVTMVESVPTG